MSYLSSLFGFIRANAAPCERREPYLSLFVDTCFCVNQKLLLVAIGNPRNPIRATKASPYQRDRKEREREGQGQGRDRRQEAPSGVVHLKAKEQHLPVPGVRRCIGQQSFPSP